MADFVDVVIQFPTIIFTVALAASFIFFVLTTLLGLGGEGGFDLDFDVGGDVGDLDADPGGLFESLGLAGIPLAVTATLVSLFAWFSSLVLMSLVGDRSTAVLVGIGFVVLVVALGIGFIAASFFSRPMSRIFNATGSRRRGDLSGQLCTVTTLKVTEDFGQAEVADASGGSHLVQIRCGDDNNLTAGDQALIFGLDTATDAYLVSPDVGEIGA